MTVEGIEIDEVDEDQIAVAATLAWRQGRRRTFFMLSLALEMSVTPRCAKISAILPTPNTRLPRRRQPIQQRRLVRRHCIIAPVEVRGESPRARPDEGPRDDPADP